jgi:uncharacterized CHY-type Zn-finger protein
MKYIQSNCTHYKHKFLVKLSCCNNYWGCYKCHNSFYKKITPDDATAEINPLCSARGKTAENYHQLKCLECGNEQDINSNNVQKCLKCGVKFDESFCLECKNLMPTEVQPYHCNICKSCYKGISHHHCDKCNNCVITNHTCRLLTEDEKCGICLEPYKINKYKVLPCSHVIHLQCLEDDEGTLRIKTCPICRFDFSTLDY